MTVRMDLRRMTATVTTTAGVMPSGEGVLACEQRECCDQDCEPSTLVGLQRFRFERVSVSACRRRATN
jgi:hypothetical protein